MSNKAPDLTKIGAIAAPQNMNISTSIIEPIQHDDSFCRFVLMMSGLHTPRKLRNDAFAGSEATNPLNPDAGKDIYQINPEYFRNTSTTVYNPEQRALEKNELTQNSPATTDILKLNLLQ